MMMIKKHTLLEALLVILLALGCGGGGGEAVVEGGLFDNAPVAMTPASPLEVFDLADYEDLTGHHMHGCFIDPWTTSLWILNGDLPEGSAIRYSDDLGQTWHKFNSNMHITGIALRGGLLFSSDQAPDGAYSARRTSPYELGDTELAFAIDDGDYWHLNYVGGSWRRGRGHPAAYAGWTVYNGTLPGVIIGSADGFTAHQIWQDAETYGRHGGVLRVVGPTASGKLIAVLRDDNDPLFAYRILTADPPQWAEDHDDRYSQLGHDHNLAKFTRPSPRPSRQSPGS